MSKQLSDSQWIQFNTTEPYDRCCVTLQMMEPAECVDGMGANGAGHLHQRCKPINPQRRGDKRGCIDAE